MKLGWTTGATVVVCLLLAIVGSRAFHFNSWQAMVFTTVLGLIGVALIAGITHFKNRQNGEASSGADQASGGDSELDSLVHDADRRLAAANAGATVANLPLIFVIGDRGSAKSSTVVNSGIEPELLAGHLYRDDVIAPTRSANLWFARGTALVEVGGGILGDPGDWMRLVKRLQPGKLKSLKGGAQSPRAVLLCVSLEFFLSQGADVVAAATRYLQDRLTDIAQTLGIRVPVYILFTKMDRMPFFIDFVGTFTDEEANQVFGVTVSMRPAQQTGVYADEETRRLAGHFDNLFYSLCDKRTVFPPRDSDPEKICGAYEFPREMRKTREALVQFMVDVCRPSQLTTSPFLRGFYFSGVRPVVVTDVVASRAQQAGYAAPGSTGATGMFRLGNQAETMVQQSVTQSMASSRKVPQWVFLGRLFNNIIFSDSAAMSASGSSVKISALRRGLLIAASVACLVLSGIFLFSFLGNRMLETDALTAVNAISAVEVPAGAVPTLASLQQLETLRQLLEKLDGYETDGAPYHLRWGLYQGSDMYPEVRRLYFAKFRALLFGQTQAGLLRVMLGVKSPPDPVAPYGYPYDTLKAYLLTTGEYKRASEKSLQDFLGNLLRERWSENRDADISKDRMDLAMRQFDYYARALGGGNPYSDKPDADAVKDTRMYLAGFKGLQRVYYGLLTEASKQRKPINFNQWAEGSSATLISVHPVAFAFTKPGAKYMQDQIGNANFRGEKWVLGDYAGRPGDTAAMQKGITDLYAKDYISQWRLVLGTSKLVPYTDLRDAVKKLSKLTSSTAPILALLSWTSQNTAIDLPGVKEAFRAVQQVEPPTVLAYVPSVQPYNDSLQNLQATIEKAVDTHDPNSMRAVHDAADSARKETRRISSTLPADPGGHVEALVGELMLKPITEIDSHDLDDLKKKSASFCSFFGRITRKFPFNPAAGPTDEATLQEIADIFRPREGQLWKLYDGGLNKVIQCVGGDCKAIDNPWVAVGPTFLSFFMQAVRFSHALYGDADVEPKLQYSLRPKKADWLEGFEIEVNGQVWNTKGDEQKNFVWPGGPKQSFVLSLMRGGPLPVKSFDGPWSVIRFLADANRMSANGPIYEFIWKWNSGITGTVRPYEYAFTVDTNGVPIFDRNFLAAMKCVPIGAK